MSYLDFEMKNQVLIRYHGRGNCVAVPAKLTHVVIPEGITEIGEQAFAGCSGIESVEIPEGVTVIRKNAFTRCKSLKTVRLPASLTEIESFAFDKCYHLEDINLSENIRKIGRLIFERNIRLKQFPDDFVILHHVLYQYLGTEKTIKIPDGVTPAARWSVNDWLFDVEHVIFPESMQTVDERALVQSEETRSITCNGIRCFLDEDDMEWLEAVELSRYIRRFFQNPEIKKNRNYLKRNLKKMILYLEDQAFQKILDTGKIFPDDQIDAYIQYAIDHQCHSKQTILINYKYQHCEFKPKNLYL